MSYILGIDTSSVELSIGLAGGDGVMAGFSRYIKHSHAEHISQSVAFLLSSCGVTPVQIDHAVIAVGPGSFTGLRIGISFVKGFCFGRSVKVLPVSSLESMAMAWLNPGAPVVSVFDARNGDVFWARFAYAAGHLVRESADTLTKAEELKKTIDGSDIVLTDTLGNGKSTVFRFLEGRPLTYPIQRYPVLRGAACARVGWAALSEPSGWLRASDITARYLNVTTMEKKLPCLSS